MRFLLPAFATLSLLSAMLALTASLASAVEIPAVSTDPKVVVDGQWGPTFPSNVPISDPHAPNVAAKVSSLFSSFNTSQPRILPNITGVVASELNKAPKVDLGPQQNLRRAKGEAINAVAGLALDAASKNDAILHWNEVALEVYAVSSMTGEQPGPVLGSRALAIVHLAIYDAYAGALGNPANLPKYLPQLEPAPLSAKASPGASVAGAAYEALLNLYPKQKALLDAALLDFCDGAKGALGLAVLQPSLVYGAYVANAMLLQRAGDPISNIVVPFGDYVAPMVPPGYSYKPDPVNPTAPLYAPYYGATNNLFAATQRFTIEPILTVAPPGSNTLTADYATVTTYGIASFLNQTGPVEGIYYPKTTRTPTQNITGTYWGYDGQPKLATPPRLYNQFTRKVAIAKGNTESQNARLFAFINAGMADAGTLIWAEKYVNFFNRPVTGLRTSNGGAPGESPYPKWIPLGGPTSNKITSFQNWTPNFPSYPSGHGGFGAAAFQLVRRFYGVPAGLAGYGPDTVFSGTVVSDEFNGVTFNNTGIVRPLVLRGYKDGGLWKAIIDNCQSRIFLGIHWTLDNYAPKNGDQFVPDLTQNVGSLPLGLTIADDIFASGGGLAPKFVGTPVTLPPVPVKVMDPASRVPTSTGANYEPIPGIGEVSNTFVRPKPKAP